MISPKHKFQLFKQSSNFCSAPWNLLYVWTDGRVQTCTKGFENLGNIQTEPLDSILHNDKFNAIRQQMRQDQTVDNCGRCIKLENEGTGTKKYEHLRNLYNEMFRLQDVDYDSNNFKLGALDLHWSSTCNLKCVTCWAQQSSSIAQEQNLPVQHTPSSVAYPLIDWIAENQHSLKEVYLSGGEPSLIKYNLYLLEKLEKRSDLLVRVNSNLTWDTDNKIIQEILKFPNVLFTCSSDSTGSKFNYIRRGADWSVFERNIRFLQQFPVKIRVNSVNSVLTALDLTDTIDFYNDKFGITDYTINQCGMEHTYLRTRNIPDQIKPAIKNKITATIDKYNYNLNLVGSLKNCLRELEHSKTEDYRPFLDNIDSLAKTHWRQVFPELV